MSIIRAEWYTGIGPRDAMELDAEQGVAKFTGVEMLVASINRILTTFPGERVMMPTFGSNLLRLLFSPYDAILMSQVQIAVMHALKMWEPRIDIVGFSVVENITEHVYELIVNYKLTGTHVVERLTFPIEVGKIFM